MSAQKRLSYGLLSTFSYTFSKNIGDVNMLTTSFFDADRIPGYQNEFNRALDRSVLGERLSATCGMSAVYDLPFGRVAGSAAGFRAG